MYLGHSQIMFAIFTDDWNIHVFTFIFFRIFDKDDDGLISVEELRHIMLSFGEKMTEKELDEMIAEANCDKDGHIDYEGNLVLRRVINPITIISFQKKIPERLVKKFWNHFLDPSFTNYWIFDLKFNFMK